MSALTDLVEGFAQLLAAEVDPAQNLTWQTDGAYPDGVTGIFVMKVPQAPDRVLTLTPYPLGDDPVFADSLVGMQVRSRSTGQDPRDVYALDDAAADVLLGNYPRTLPNGVRVQTLTRISAVSLGQDNLDRWEWASSYRASVHRPGPHRL